MKNTAIFVLVLAASVSLFSCQKKRPAKTKEQVMAERLQEKMERWRADAAKACLKTAEDRAIAIVDSTIIANARFSRDTSDLPDVPGRPVRPDFVPPKDSTPVKPILDSLK